MLVGVACRLSLKPAVSLEALKLKGASDVQQLYSKACCTVASLAGVLLKSVAVAFPLEKSLVFCIELGVLQYVLVLGDLNAVLVHQPVMCLAGCAAAVLVL